MCAYQRDLAESSLASFTLPSAHTFTHRRSRCGHTALRDKSNVCHIKDLPVTIKDSLSPSSTLIHSLRLSVASLKKMTEVTEPRGGRREARVKNRKREKAKQQEVLHYLVENPLMKLDVFKK